MTEDERAMYEVGRIAYGKCYSCGHVFIEQGWFPTADGVQPDIGPCNVCERENQ